MRNQGTDQEIAHEVAQEVAVDISSHTTGVHKGEEESDRGRIGRHAVRRSRTSRDATSINADKRAPIDPRMPNMPPA